MLCAVAPRLTPWLLMFVVLQCISCFYECRCRSDGVLIQFACQLFNLMVIQHEVCQRFVCMVFVNSPHNSNEDMWGLTSLYPHLCRLEISTLCCAYPFWNWRSADAGQVSSQNVSSIKWTSHWLVFSFLSLGSCWKSELQVVTRE